MKPKILSYDLSLLVAGAALSSVSTTVQAAEEKPKISDRTRREAGAAHVFGQITKGSLLCEWTTGTV